MNKMHVTSMIIRVCIVGFWIILFFVLLFIPVFTRLIMKEKSITIFTWPLILDAHYLKQFEQQTGIKLYISYYESNEELLSKIRATKGRGYDILIPSDYAVEELIQEGLVKKIDRSQLNFLDHLDPKLLHHYFDLQQEYSLPYF